MSNAFQLGPFLFSTHLILLIVSVVIALSVAEYLGKKEGIQLDKSLWIIGLAVILGGRIPFVATYFSMYADEPVSFVDIRDGGFISVTAILSGFVVALLISRHVRSHRRPLLIALFCGCVVWSCGTFYLISQRPTHSLPRLNLLSLEGKHVQLDAFRGRPVVVNLWASWCPPCRREMSVLQSAQARNSDITFIFVNQSEGLETTRQYLEKENLHLQNVLLDDRAEFARLSSAKGTPTTLFYDRHGRLIESRIGELSAATLEHFLVQLR